MKPPTIILLILILGLHALVLMPGAALAEPNATGNAGNTSGNSGNTGGNSGNTGIDVQSYLSNLYLWFLGFVGISALLAIVYGGILYMFSGTSLTKTEQAKKLIGNAIFGIVIAAASFLLLSVINPDLINHGFDITCIVDKALGTVTSCPTSP